LGRAETVTTYTVRIERADHDIDRWEPMVADETVDDERTAQELCDSIGLLQTVADGRPWRVRVWAGEDVNREPDAEAHPQRTS
jgi:hypothetical protein